MLISCLPCRHFQGANHTNPHELNLKTAVSHRGTETTEAADKELYLRKALLKTARLSTCSVHSVTPWQFQLPDLRNWFVFQGVLMTKVDGYPKFPIRGLQRIEEVGTGFICWVRRQP
jgi:hypothetical protein